jgi:hypothetical protein
MTRRIRTALVVALALFPSPSYAELRRVEITVLGMD